MSLLIAILFGSVDAGPAPAPQPAADRVMALEERFASALLKRDAAVLGQLLADDLLHIGFEGQIVGKAAYMAFFKEGAWRYVKYQPSNVSVKVSGTAAVVTGRVDRTIVVNDKETTGAFAFTHVWFRSGNGWRITSSHVTAVPDPESGAKP